MAADAVRRLGVRCTGIEQVAATLSGGNQQKVVIGKWLATGPRVLLLDEPTRGIDVGAKQEIYALIRALAAEGLAIVMVSSELPELLLLADRILVMCEGRPTGMLARAEASEEAIMHLAAPQRPRRGWRRDAAAPPVAHQALLGPGGDLPDRRADLAGQLQGQQHLPQSYGNLLDVLRQVSITGLIATGMTAVILTAGIDLSVGSIMALCSVVCAMLLTVPGWTPAAAMGLPALALAVFVDRSPAPPASPSAAPRPGRGAGRRADVALDPLRGLVLPAAVGLAGAAAGALASCCRRSRPSSACSACSSSRPASASSSAPSTASSSSAAGCSRSSSRWR